MAVPKSLAEHRERACYRDMRRPFDLTLGVQITWDDKSLFIRGERIMIFSGEFHPFR
jgi:hypothetical protein